MIPKIIHYCWFGGKELPKDAKKCIDSWKKYCPDFEIKEWNESNYDINKCNRMKQAYDAKKWGFVPDYARADIIYNNGGIYFDTDVELVKPIDDLLNYKAFFGFGSLGEKINEDEVLFNTIQLGLGFGGEKGQKIFKDITNFYESISFYKENGEIDLTPAPLYETKIFEKFGFDLSSSNFQEIDKIAVFPPDYFCPMDYRTGKLEITNNTYSIHLFSMSWMTEKEQYYKKLEWKYTKKYGYKKAYKIVRRKSFFYRAFRKIKKILLKAK